MAMINEIVEKINQKTEMIENIKKERKRECRILLNYATKIYKEIHTKFNQYLDKIGKSCDYWDFKKYVECKDCYVKSDGCGQLESILIGEDKDKVELISEEVLFGYRIDRISKESYEKLTKDAKDKIDGVMDKIKKESNKHLLATLEMITKQLDREIREIS